jgi:hypothetical protein
MELWIVLCLCCAHDAIGMGPDWRSPGDGNQHWNVMSTYFRVYEFGMLRFSWTVCSLLIFIQVIVNEENAHDTKDFIEKRLAAIKSQRSSGEIEDLALIIGPCLHSLLSEGNAHSGFRR